MKNSIKIYSILSQTHALGPFFRFALWVQGCFRECPGCMTPEARPFDCGIVMNIDELAAKVLSTPDIEGITISGGEPFMQAGVLNCLIKRIRENQDMGVIVYTGYTLEELDRKSDSEDGRDIQHLLEQTDLLIDGPYIRELDDGLSLRGSSNQVVHCLTDRYAEIADQYYGQPERNVELHLLENEVFLAGIPGKDALGQWKKSITPDQLL